MTSAPLPTPYTPIGRIPVVDVGPTLENGRWPTKAVVGERVPVHATVFREGHDAVAASAVLVAPDGTDHSWAPMTDVSPGNDHLLGHLVPDAEGLWGFRVEGWSDPYGTWEHDAEIKVPAQIDVELMLAEGALVLDRCAEADALAPAQRATLTAAAARLRDTDADPLERLHAGTSAAVHEVLAEHPLRDHVSPSATYPLRVHRTLALYGSWYEFFPRSEGATFDPETGSWTSGTLRTAARRLPAIKAMGFDVAYLTPIHPIGVTNRKGRNNTLAAEPGDPGSPYGIGSPDGGMDAIHPDLGTVEDFEAFVADARGLGLEVALDIALNASPDHPWVSEHPQWFTTLADGSIAYAENPPKKYQDIYPYNFDNDPEGIYLAMRDVLVTWVERGVTLFRIDNPHTKPLTFWERLLREFDQRYPEVIFLSEAFTKPAMMRTLAAIGFHQSYTYYTWRLSASELGEYLAEVTGDLGAVMRPSFWPTTHDILTPYMQQGGEPAFALRAVIAATGSPTWGIYAGYELAESVARPGAQEQIDNEKYEYKPRDWEAAAQRFGLTTLLTRLNEIRAAHPALQQLRNLTVHGCSDDAVLCFSKRIPADASPDGVDDTVIVAVTTDPYTTRSGHLYLDMKALGLAEDAEFIAHDELSGQTFAWGSTPFVRLDPHGGCAHIVTVRRA